MPTTPSQRRNTGNTRQDRTSPRRALCTADESNNGKPELIPRMSKLQQGNQYKLELQSPKPLGSEIKWYRNDHLINLVHIIDSGPNQKTLTIPSVQFNDAGEYRVVGSDFELEAVLIVTSSEEPKFLQVPGSEINKFENEDCSLQYKISDNILDVKFFKKEVLSNNDRIEVIPETGGLWKVIIKRLQQSDSGEYQAMCENTTSNSTKIKVGKRKLTFLKQPASCIKKFKGEGCSLQYEVSDKQRPLELFKTSTPSGPGKKPTTHGDTEICPVVKISSGLWQLDLKNVETSDSGEYFAECWGVRSDETKLNVLEGLNDKYLYKLAEEISPEERMSLGMSFNFRAAKLSGYEYNHPSNLQQQVFSMLVGWRNRQGGDAETIIRDLGEHLASIGRTDLKTRLFKDNELAYRSAMSK